ncbi:hypothetical protein BGZ95_010249 [Linnemannia exigua]|uniref:Uncharacterized protein n=1 Tax=Linnemannia exigua TaxID=604196 RepID=A0AAD4DBQ6_9FUNG|nr:hypothetical protein BGZ95_010249 [Linnemannia exigua]
MNQNTSDQGKSASAMRSSNQHQESTAPAQKQQLQEQRSETPSHSGQSNIEAPMSGSKMCGHVSDCDCSTETAIHASEEHAPRTNQASTADGVTLFGDHHIYLAEASLIYQPKLGKEVEDKFCASTSIPGYLCILLALAHGILDAGAKDLWISVELRPLNFTLAGCALSKSMTKNPLQMPTSGQIGTILSFNTYFYLLGPVLAVRGKFIACACMLWLIFWRYNEKCW